jgi:hypothetical protein
LSGLAALPALFGAASDEDEDDDEDDAAASSAFFAGRAPAENVNPPTALRLHTDRK